MALSRNTFDKRRGIGRCHGIHSVFFVSECLAALSLADAEVDTRIVWDAFPAFAFLIVRGSTSTLILHSPFDLQVQLARQWSCV